MSGQEEKKLKSLVQEVCKQFFISCEDEVLEAFRSQRVKAKQEFSEIAKVFEFNVSALISTISIPYKLAHASATQRHYQRIFTAAKIRALTVGESDIKSGENLEEIREQSARKETRSKYYDFICSTEGIHALIEDSMSFLDSARKEEEFSNAANELMLQGVILCWSAFENYMRDVFINLLNKNPQLVQQIYNCPNAKKRFENRKISIEELAEYNYDLSSCVGNYLANQQDFSDVTSIKVIFTSFLPTCKSLLENEELRKLSEYRHLIVHRRGIVDEKFRKKTGLEITVGNKIIVDSDDLEKYLDVVISTAGEILTAVNCLSPIYKTN